MASIPKKKSTPVTSKSALRTPSRTNHFLNDYLPSILLAIVVLLIGIVRWRLVGMPLERDEGEYAYFGQLILKGIPPYSESYNMKLPGIYYMYALILFLFGETYRGIHIGLLAMNAATMIFLFLSIKKLFSATTGWLTAGFYGLMAITFNVLGFAAHATHFAVFYVSIALYFFARYQENKKVLTAFLFGLMMGMAFLMKQQAAYFILFGGMVFLSFHLLNKDKNLKKMLWDSMAYSIGVFVPYLLVVMVMLLSGTFDKFWFWTVSYASNYASGLPWEQGNDLLAMTFKPIWNEFEWIGILALLGMLIVLMPSFSSKKKVFAYLFFVFASLCTTPGFYFRQHYFIVFLPAAALLAAIAVAELARLLSEKLKMVWVAVLIPFLLFVMIYNRVMGKAEFFYAAKDPIALCDYIYGTNPFVESLEIARYIAANSAQEDKIAVLGSEPQIAFYSGRKSATGHIYTYGLMEIHEYNLKMQEEMIAEIERNKPLFLVFCNIPFSWLTKPDSPKKIFEWYNRYAADNYMVTGLVDIPDQGASKTYWGKDAQRNPHYQNSVWIFKRKS